MPAVDSDNFDFLDLTALTETNSQCGSENGVPLTSRIPTVSIDGIHSRISKENRWLLLSNDSARLVTDPLW